MLMLIREENQMYSEGNVFPTAFSNSLFSYSSLNIPFFDFCDLDETKVGLQKINTWALFEACN